MFQLVKKKLKDQRGLTLIELLAVVVILGIIAAIAVPSIGGLIDNSKKDAHVANAQQMINSAKLAITTDANLQSGQHYLTLGYLEAQNFVDPIKDPDGTVDTYLDGGATILPSTTTNTTAISYVYINNGKVESVKLVNNTKNRGVQNADKTPVAADSLGRGKVNSN
jgi:type IV pilus assembly protein PilA